MLITSITNFRNNAKEWLDKILDTSEELAITTKKGNFILVEESEYRSWQETNYIQNNPTLMGSIQKSKEDREKGKVTKHDNLKQLFDHLDEI